MSVLRKKDVEMVGRREMDNEGIVGAREAGLDILLGYLESGIMKGIYTRLYYALC